MLKFAVYPLALEASPRRQDLRPSEVLCGLPDFCYDMHTRVGKRTLVRLCADPELRDFFQRHPTSRRTEPIGWAVFLIEGGAIPGGLADPQLSELEEKFLVFRFSWDVDTWRAFKHLMNSLLLDGRVNTARRSVLAEMYKLHG